MTHHQSPGLKRFILTIKPAFQIVGWWVFPRKYTPFNHQQDLIDPGMCSQTQKYTRALLAVEGHEILNGSHRELSYREGTLTGAL